MTKISDLADGGALQSTDYLIVVRSGANVKVQADGSLVGEASTFFVDAINNRVGVLNETPDVSLDAGNATDAMHVPVGTTAQRPGTPAAGYFRYNTSLAQFEGYTDTWGAIGGGGTNTFTFDSFTGDNTTVDFVLSQATNLEANLIVFIDGVFQTQDAYTISTVAGVTTLTFSSAPATGRYIAVYTVAAGVSGNNMNLDSFSGDGSTTDFTLSINAINENNTQIFIDGVYQQKDGYTVTNTTLSFSAAPPLNSTIEVMTFTQTEVNVPVDNSIEPIHIKAGDFYFDTDTLYIDSVNNRVGVGTASPATALDVAGTVTADGLTVLSSAESSLRSADETPFQLVIGNNTASSTSTHGLRIKQLNSGAVHLDAYDGAGEALLLNALTGGNVGIGETNPTEKLTIAKGISYNTDSALYTIIGTNDTAVNNNAVYRWRTGITGDATGHDYTFSTLARSESSYVQRIVIDSSGNLLVGTLNAVPTSDDGVAIGSSGYVYATRDGDIPLLVNRLTSDGDIAVFRKDGSTVGSIGTNLSEIYIGTGDVGLFTQSANDRILPYDPSTNGGRDAAIDLGSSSTRFKDLYLSGGVVFPDAGGAGTATSNTLDSYEEGTFTLTVTASGYTIASQENTYTKIGNRVFLTGSVVFSAIGTNNSQVTFSGCPFAEDFASDSVVGVARENTTNGDIFSALLNGATLIMNSMDGVSGGSNQIFLTSKKYGYSLNYTTS